MRTPLDSYRLMTDPLLRKRRIGKVPNRVLVNLINAQYIEDSVLTLNKLMKTPKSSEPSDRIMDQSLRTEIFFLKLLRASPMETKKRKRLSRWVVLKPCFTEIVTYIPSTTLARNMRTGNCFNWSPRVVAA